MFTNFLNDFVSGCLDRDDWQPFPTIDQREAWENMRLPPGLDHWPTAITRFADKVLLKEIDPLSGTMYTHFMVNGDRSEYEENYFRRRIELSYLVIAECLTAERHYLPKIIDYIWEILGEIYWCVPAHNFAHHHEMILYKAVNPWNENDPFPVPDDEYLDLFNCETAGLLAETCYLLQPLLLDEYPALYHLIHQQIETRVLSKFESSRLYGWYNGKNNWTVWCAHNLLLTACYLVDDKHRLVSITDKLCVLVSRFVDNLKESGSCIEGPTYWNVSAGRLAAFIALLEARFRVDFNIKENLKLRHFGEHILKLHIGGNRYVNFADGALKVDLDHGLLSKYAQLIDSEQLGNLVIKDSERAAAQCLQQTTERGGRDYMRQSLVHLTRQLFWTPQIADSNAVISEKSVWLDDMQVMVARDQDVPGTGMCVSAIAGSNDELINHHSHNDIGHFSVYFNGEPIIIDLGQGAYSRETFSDTRYDMWHISSVGHNVPVINGRVQRHGVGAHATEVEFVQNQTQSILSFNSAVVYGYDDEKDRIHTRIAFDHEKSVVTIEENIELSETLNSLEFPLYMTVRDVIQQSGHIVLLSMEDKTLRIEANNLVYQGVEKIELTDVKHREVWGEAICKLRFVAEDLAKNSFGFSISLVGG
ncbi:heparinase II/III domain-containing protein [Vibrio quintilis]|uniref:Heparinase II/III-like protein n=1 Tax=Vibrio quintilis TaxID=1117707 RepID=A0A1M7YPT3_9VIBR|nr:heparinase II/III family protein [Vibrio quintilis]SHO54639.1 Heparinase II/III-like protein [Vibrio quintilis]